MNRHEWDRRHVESIVDVRKIVSVQQIHHRREVTTYLGKTGGYCDGGRSPPSKSVGWKGDQLHNLKWRTETMRQHWERGKP
jgi:hypothetical protein